MRFSIIIFAYNEVNSLSTVFYDVLNFLSGTSEDYEIILVNDGSSDGTDMLCSQLKDSNPNVTLITHPNNKGIGMALRSGYMAATKEYVCAIPGDGQFNIDELRAVQPFDANTYYSFYRPQTNYNRYRNTLTWINRLFNQHVLGIFLRDVNWIKVYRKEQIHFANPQLKSSLVESEICAKLYKAGVMPVEIPSQYLPRKSGVAKGGNWKTLRKAIAETLKLWWTATTFKLNI
ncbi:MAG: glycosyltransferase family 2 protein [Chitinophagales bacterium]|nr:glycosyltransferase family 2 protein [Chitinophagales bacterium]